MSRFEKIFIFVALMLLVMAYPWLAFFPLMIIYCNDRN